MKSVLNKLKEIAIKFKNTDVVTKFLLAMSVIFMGILIVYMVGQLQHIHAYHQREAWGNARWMQVDETLKGYEDRIKELETKLELLQ
jgi:cell fate (sporulation/competence/biofilm development) regulator YmcA (YheA/YmcA/DUF963 family)